MGHIALIAVDIISALEKYPDDLLAIIEPLLPLPAWEDYVHGTYAETQRIENIVLGGPKPVSFMRNTQGQGESGWGGEWNDGEDMMSPTGEFRRGPFSGQQTADFGPPDEEEDGNFHFNANTGLAPNAWGSSSSSDSEDEHDTWIKNSESAAGSRHSRDPESVGFDDSFDDNFQPSTASQVHVATTQEEVRVIFCPLHWYTERPVCRTTALAPSQMQTRTLPRSSVTILETKISTLASSSRVGMVRRQ